jgi:hypothetical protein
MKPSDYQCNTLNKVYSTGLSMKYCPFMNQIIRNKDSNISVLLEFIFQWEIQICEVSYKRNNIHWFVQVVDFTMLHLKYGRARWLTLERDG